jgi:hypothetical protein
MIGRITPLQVVVLLAIGSIGLLAPQEYRIRAVVGIIVSCALLLTFYQYTFGSKRNARAELTHRVKIIPRIMPHRFFFFLTVFSALLSVIFLQNPLATHTGIVFGVVAVVAWALSRVVARLFLGGASSWSLLVGSAPIFFPPATPPQPQGQEWVNVPMEAPVPAAVPPKPPVQVLSKTVPGPTSASFGPYGQEPPPMADPKADRSPRS